jgi:hypothetical protein
VFTRCPFPERAFRKLFGTIPHAWAFYPAKYKTKEINMRKILASVIALAVLGIAAPIAAISSAEAKTVIIKKDRGHHYGWNKHRGDRRWDRPHHRRGTKVIIHR